MIAIAYYLLKVVICSAILYGYYHLALRNKLFHQWNRFYLMGAVAVSILLPLATIQIDAPAEHNSKIISALQIVNGADEFMTETAPSAFNIWNAEYIATLVYTFVSLLMMFIFVRALERIRVMIRRNQAIALDDFYFLNTSEPGTPFSFMKYLLWNNEIPIDTENGQRIMEHELVHIREKHSWDKIFMQITLIFFWINPFFWLIRRELTLVHEFIADQRSIGKGDAQAFAKLLLETSFPGYAPHMTNSFFRTSIKRRLAMITKTHNTGFNYISRLMLIPVLFILLFTFVVKAKTMIADNISYTPLAEPVTVVIDAGHGGEDAGAISGNIKEKELNLAIAKLVKELNTNPKINIVLTRESDFRTPLQERTLIAQQKKADVFLSVHINSAPDAIRSGIQTSVAGQNMEHDERSSRLANILLSNFSNLYAVDNKIRQNKDRKVWVLDQNTCPAVVLECGYLTNEKDLAFITNRSNQEQIARKILASIDDYFSSSVTVTSAKPVQDTVPAPKKLKQVTFVYEDGKTETMTPEQYWKKTGKNIVFTSDSIYVNGTTLTLSKAKTTDAVYTIDGKPAHKVQIEALKPTQISSVNVATTKPGEPSRIDILTKENANASGKTITTTSPSGTVNGQVTVNSGTKDSMTLNINGTIGTNGAVTIKGDPTKPKPLYVIDGKEMTEDELKLVNPNDIESINVLKGEAAEKLYKEKGRNGVIVISLKK